MCKSEETSFGINAIFKTWLKTALNIKQELKGQVLSFAAGMNKIILNIQARYMHVTRFNDAE